MFFHRFLLTGTSGIELLNPLVLWDLDRYLLNLALHAIYSSNVMGQCDVCVCVYLCNEISSRRWEADF